MGDAVGVHVVVGVDDGVKVPVKVGVGVPVSVGVDDDVEVQVKVGVGDDVGVQVMVGVMVGVRVDVGDALAVAIGDIAVDVALGVTMTLARPASGVALAVSDTLAGAPVTTTGILGRDSDAEKNWASTVGVETGMPASWGSGLGAMIDTVFGVKDGDWVGAALDVGLIGTTGAPLGIRPDAGKRVTKAIKVDTLRCLGCGLDVGVGVIHLREIGDLGATGTRRSEMHEVPVDATTRSNKIEPRYVRSCLRVFMVLLSDVDG